MHNTQLMNILDGVQQLVVHLRSLEFVYSPVLDDVVKQFPVLHVLHHEEEVFGSLYDLVKLDDVGVSDCLEYVDLSSDPLHVCHVHNSFLL